MSAIYSAKTNYQSPMRLAGIVGLVAAAAAVAGAFISGPAAFFQAYLFGFLFWLGISLGLMAFLLLHFLVSSRWGLTIRRIAEAGAGLLVLMAVLFIPLLLGMQYLYPWTRPEVVAASEMLQHKTFFLNVPGFIIRAVVYFAIWVGLALLVNRQIARLGSSPSSDLAVRGRLQKLGAAGLILYVLTMSFAAIDWVMSLEPTWTSTAFGLIMVLAQVQTGISFAVLMVNLLPGLSLGRRWNYATTPVPFQDLGALMMTSVMSFAYVAYFQYLIIWAGNIPREVVWYIERIQGGWMALILFVTIFQFVLPFLILLSIRARHNLRILAVLAGILLFSNLVNLFWHIKPAFFPEGFALSWLDIILPLAIGGLWLAGFFYLLSRRPALAPVDEAAIGLTESKGQSKQHAH